MITPTSSNTHISSDWGSLLEPGLRKVFMDEYKKMPEQYKSIFKIENSSRSFEQELGMGAFQTWSERINETDNVDYQKIGEGELRTYTHSEFASGFAIGKRLYEDEMYNIINKAPADLARAGVNKVETDAVSVLNGGFANSGYDSVSLFSASHPYEGDANKPAGVQSNLITGALSDTTLKTAITTMRGWKDNGGKRIICMPDTLVVPAALEHQARILIESQGRPNTGNNDKNVINSDSRGIKVVVYDYLTSDTAWFLVDSKNHMLKFFWRIKPQFNRAKDDDNFVSKYNGRMRYSYGYSDWRGIVGSTGV